MINILSNGKCVIDLIKCRQHCEIMRRRKVKRLDKPSISMGKRLELNFTALWKWWEGDITMKKSQTTLVAAVAVAGAITLGSTGVLGLIGVGRKFKKSNY